MPKFNRPTAKDLAEYFQSLPPDAKFRIVDPDTGWRISIFLIEHGDSDNTAWLYAEYSDMNEEPQL